ncbi:uncharacterized protein TNCV_1999031 [Trichonephila clavipes]|nr:uncharacterized protein TNCV_1999031 [Trichonephila clavipes]
MTTTSYRVPAAVGVRHLFPSRPYSTVWSRLGARGTMTTTSYRGLAAVGVRILFSVEVLLFRPVASWCTRNDENDILPQALGGCSSLFFPSRQYAAVRSRLGARGTMRTTSYCGHAAVDVRIPFSVEALLCCPVTFWCTRNDDNDILPQPLGGRCSSLFSVEALFCCPVVSWCTRNDENDILPQLLCCGCSSPFPSRSYSAVRSRLEARGTMTTTPSCFRAAVGVRHLFSVEALLYFLVASWCKRNDDNDIVPRTRGGEFSSFFRRGTTLLSCRVLVDAGL